MLANRRRPLRRALLVGSTAVSILQGLFLLSEPGWVYDPSQLDTMFQDIAGTTPVTGPGDPVGLNLDKRLWGGRSLAQIRAANEARSSGAIALTGSATAATYNTGTGVGTATRVDSGNQSHVDFAATAGLLYEIDIENTSGANSLEVRPASLGSAFFTVAAGVRTSRMVLATDALIAVCSAGNGQAINFTVHGFRLIPGFHRGQSTSAARPTLSRVPYGGRRNWILRTEAFTDGAWTKSNSTASDNAAIAPDGTNTAASLLDNAVSNTHYVQQSMATVNGQPFTQTVYAKPNGNNWIRLGDNSTFAAYFDVANGVVGTVTGVATATSIQPAANGYYKCTVTITAAGTSTFARIATAPTNGGASYAGDGTKGCYLWHPQFEAGTVSTDYQKVTSTHDVTETGKADCWYFSYDGTDDHFVSLANLNAPTDKGMVAGAVRKNTDHAGLIVELTANFNNNATANGRFAVICDTGNVFGAGHKTGTTSTGYSFYTSAATAAEYDAVVMTTHDLAAGTETTELPLYELNGVNAKSVSSGFYADNNPPTFATDLVYWGRRGGSSLPFNGHEYASVARFAAIPSAGQIAALRTYMANKAGYAL